MIFLPEKLLQFPTHFKKKPRGPPVFLLRPFLNFAHSSCQNLRVQHRLQRKNGCIYIMQGAAHSPRCSLCSSRISSTRSNIACSLLLQFHNEDSSTAATFFCSLAAVLFASNTLFSCSACSVCRRVRSRSNLVAYSCSAWLTCGAGSLPSLQDPFTTHYHYTVAVCSFAYLGDGLSVAVHGVCRGRQRGGGEAVGTTGEMGGGCAGGSASCAAYSLSVRSVAGQIVTYLQ